MQYLFDAWTKLTPRLKAANHVLLLSDFDGTLIPIVDNPELAILPPETKNLLRTLAKNRRYTVGIVSGRALADLKSKVDVDSIIYAGNHGLEIEGFGSDFLDPIAEEMRPFFLMLSQALSATLRGIKGVFVENKGLTLSVHYRSVDDTEERRVTDAFSKVTDPLHITGRIRITQGKKVYEIRPPVDWDKGKAIAWLIAKCKESRGKGGALPIYLGDDLTDEDGFKMIEKNNGISIFVGGEGLQSVARYFLRSPEEVTELLKML
ncbi:MAG: trehalose-phosphatase [Dehalococcoidia bacterium]|nr:MAG: trehalose-phosphatase [Dehalococcoidia bacterium]